MKRKIKWFLSNVFVAVFAVYALQSGNQNLVRVLLFYAVLWTIFMWIISGAVSLLCVFEKGQDIVSGFKGNARAVSGWLSFLYDFAFSSLLVYHGHWIIGTIWLSQQVPECFMMVILQSEIDKARKAKQ